MHTNDIGAAVEAGIDAGRPHSIRVTDLMEQVEEERWVREAEVVADLTDAARRTLTPVTTAVVAVGVGDGVRRLLTSLGVQRVVAGGQSMNPSTAQILEAVEACASDCVIVLPNNKNIVAGRPPGRRAHREARRGRRRPRACPRRSPRSSSTTPTPSSTRTRRRCRRRASACAPARSRRRCATPSSTSAQIRKGDWIALSRDGIVATTGSPSDAVCELLGKLVDDDSEIVTVLVGADAAANETERIREHIEVTFPHLEVEFHDGGQPLYRVSRRRGIAEASGCRPATRRSRCGTSARSTWRG